MANPNWKADCLRALLIVAATFWVFAPSLQGDWLMDDDFYLTQNVLMHDPARLWKTWFAPGSLIEYYPIEASLQALQWHLWHMNTLGYHLTNLILHIISSLLVWRLLSKFGLRLAWLGGFLFAIHPTNVESVAWISEFKNTLSLPPFLLAICVWIDYEDHERPRDYWAALGLFIVAMLCKISMALFPLIILLFAWWKRDRIGWRDLKASAPFFAVSLILVSTSILAGIRYHAAQLETIANPDIGGFPDRLALAGQSLAFYFAKFVWPVELIPIYPKWPVDPQSLISFLPWLSLALVIVWFWSKRATWGRHALLGIGFFLINLLPFVGLTSVSYMAFTWVMDHFLYLPMIGLIALAVAGLGQMEDRLSVKMRPFLAITTAVALALLAWESQAYAEMFAGPEKLWTYTIQRNPSAWLAYNNLGNALLETGRPQEAMNRYQTALVLNPRMVEAHNNLGFTFCQLGRTQEGIEEYREALKYAPHFKTALTNLGDALVATGRGPEAIPYYEQALLVDHNDGDALANLAKLRAGPKTSP